MRLAFPPAPDQIHVDHLELNPHSLSSSDFPIGVAAPCGLREVIRTHPLLLSYVFAEESSTHSQTRTPPTHITHSHITHLPPTHTRTQLNTEEEKSHDEESVRDAALPVQHEEETCDVDAELSTWMYCPSNDKKAGSKSSSTHAEKQKEQPKEARDTALLMWHLYWSASQAETALKKPMSLSHCNDPKVRVICGLQLKHPHIHTHTSSEHTFKYARPRINLHSWQSVSRTAQRGR